MKNDEKQLSFNFINDNKNCGEKINKNNLQNSSVSLYEELRLKLGDYFNFHFKFLHEEITNALNSEKKSDLYRYLHYAEERSQSLCEESKVMNDTFVKDNLNKKDYQNLERFYGKEIANYEKLKRGYNNE